MLRLYSMDDIQTLEVTKWDVRQPAENDTERENALNSGKFILFTHYIKALRLLMSYLIIVIFRWFGSGCRPWSRLHHYRKTPWSGKRVLRLVP